MYYVFYLTSERQGLYLGDKKILTVEQVQNGVKPPILNVQLSFSDILKEEKK